ncbi:DNA/RNA non-specific endonuclease [Aquimarina litoralis]|uniref:DNA/RNA non-specific endonuclease n=1 Tax=Aquimarina litoralis TaxID=584605 RepID=UPI001C5731DB|nr:DNA/RNA non-specific endonuclease [Aquimarina litoralis]MBW1298255.1 DNA/RNA non-specific endonuclease [Aquimarina litoralis]
MKLLKLNPILCLLFFAIYVTSCNVDDDNFETEIPSIPNTIAGELKTSTFLYDNEGPHDYSFHGKVQDGFIETYESGSKSSYAAASVSLASGDWYLSDALLGSLANDRKYQSKSVRIRNTGYAIMSFNMDNGAETIRVRHAKYGNDGTSTWRLIASYDDGASWYYVGNTITTNSTTLNTVSFDVNETASVRYGIQKLSGGSNRINIDNVEVITSATGGGNAGIDSNITFGNPSDAGTSSTNYYLSKPDFSLSYNNNTGTSNWVSWHLSSAWLGDTPRCNCFKRDNDLPSSFFRATSSDYTNSGFDRGHLCPSADRNGSEDSNENTYYMSNIAPQAPDNNRKSWANFESYLRSLTLDGNEVHIIAGVAGSGGTGGNGFANTIDGGNITVPDSFWKVALILPNGSNDINRVTTSTRVIAINVPNDQGISNDWTQFRTSVDAIESLTGYDLFENIANSVESVIESTIDNGPSS